MAVYVEPQKKYTEAKATTIEAVEAGSGFMAPVWGAEFDTVMIQS
jgi:hypothetical protein